MADTTQIEQDIQTCRLRACAERRAGNAQDGNAWDAEADDLENRLIALSRNARWSELVDNRHG